MDKLELKPNIFIEGFDTSKEMVREQIGRNKELEFRTTLYEGKTSEIPELLLEQVCDFQNKYEGIVFKDYSKDAWVKYSIETPRKSIKTACNNEYCIIYKTN